MPIPRVFISYARSDGESFAVDLRRRLEREHPDLPLWQDRAQMEGGVGWWKQIQDALDHVEYMVLVATPNAMQSEMVKKEWRYARQQGVCIYPVRVPGLPLDFNGLPRWMRDVHFYDLDHEWERFILGLKSTCRQERVPFMAPDLPEGFVERPAEYGQLIDHLLDRTRENPLAITTALRGAGGFGKTTLAAALCHDEDVITCFDDGILWVTLGEQPSVLQQLGDLYVALTGDKAAYSTEEGLAAALAEKLADKDCLIVIDDVWNTAHLRPFLRGGERCARLVTTRNFQIAVDVSAQQIPVDEMTSGESVQMLGKGIADLPDDLSPFAALAARLGEWPLLLELANAFVRECLGMGDTLPAALSYLNQALDEEGLDVINREDEDERKRGALSTLGASLRMLKTDERQRLIELAIFPDDTDIPLATVGQVWGSGAAITRRVCQRLAGLSFFRLNLGDNTLRFHDVLRASLQAQLADAPAVHARLLDAWGGDVYALPPGDAYAWRWGAYHLHNAGRDDVLLALFADQRWMRLRFEHDGYTYTGYLEDLMIAWRDVIHPQALAQIAAQRDPAALADCMRLALIHTSINSLAGNYVPELVARAVETGLWTADRALSIARRVPDAWQRTEMVTLLLATGGMGPHQRLEAQTLGLEAASAIRSERNRAEALAGLAGQLEGEQKIQALQSGLETALALEVEGDRARALVGLASQLEGDLLQRGLEAALALCDEGNRARALVGLAGQLEGDLLQRGLKAALALETEQDRTEALVGLAGQLEGDLLQRGLEAALAIRDEGDRARVLVGLASQLEGDLLQRGLEAALALETERNRARALAGLAGQLEGEQLQRGLEAALAICVERVRAEALIGLAGRLKGDQKTQVLQRGLEAALAIPYKGERVRALAGLADQLVGDQKAQALQAGLEAALAIRDERMQAEALAGLADQLVGNLLQRGLEAALALEDERARAEALAGLAVQLEGDLLQRGLEAALALRDEGDQARALAGLVVQLEGDQKVQVLQRGLEVALALRDEGDRAEALAGLAGQLEGELLQRGLEAALAIQNERARAEALAGLAGQLEEEQKAQILQRELKAVLAIPYEGERARVLAGLAGQLDGDLLQRGLEAALAIRDEGARAKVLAGLANRLDGDLLPRGLEAALAIRDERTRIRVLAGLVGQLVGEQKAQALQRGLEAALALRDEYWRAEALAGLADQLESEQKTQVLQAALEAVLTLEDEWDRAEALIGLVGQLEGELLQRGVGAALALRNEYWRGWALAKLIDQLEGEQKTQVLKTGIDAALALENQRDRAQALVAFLPYCTDPASVVMSIRQAVVGYVFSIRDAKRERVLWLCAGKNLSAPSVVSQEIVVAIARHIIEICTEWTWL